MKKDDLETGEEILNNYFTGLSKDTEIDQDFRSAIFELWKQKKLNTSTYLRRVLDELLEKESK